MTTYERLWRDALAAFARGEPQIDPHLADKKNDLRRGVTIALRPSPSVSGQIKVFLNQLVEICPEQYFYHLEELHVTVLSIISGTENWRKEIRHLASCRTIISEVLNHQPPFKIRFQGVTASPGSVMIQGFPMDDGLEKVRTELREAFALKSLAGQLDRRYKISTGHMTAMRFCKPVMDWKRLTTLLKENRQTNFGEMEVNRLQLVWGDWYASANTVRTLQEYRLTT